MGLVNHEGMRFLFVVVLSLVLAVLPPEANGSSCEICDEHNTFGLAYELDCADEFDKDKELIKCTAGCAFGCKCRGEIFKRKVILECEAHCSTTCAIIWVVIALIFLAIIGVAVFFLRRRKK